MIHIPESMEACTSRLVDLGNLATAIDWERSALIAALVRPTRKGGSRGSELGNIAQLYASFREFAELGIVGLRSHHTVKWYYDCWMNECGFNPELGDQIDLPDKEFPVRAPGQGTPRVQPGEVRLHPEPTPQVDPKFKGLQEKIEQAKRAERRRMAVSKDEKGSPVISASIADVLDDPDETLQAIRNQIADARALSEGDSNDAEIEAWQGVGDYFDNLDFWLTEGYALPSDWRRAGEQSGDVKP